MSRWQDIHEDQWRAYAWSAYSITQGFSNLSQIAERQAFEAGWRAARDRFHFCVKCGQVMQ